MTPPNADRPDAGRVLPYATPTPRRRRRRAAKSIIFAGVAVVVLPFVWVLAMFGLGMTFEAFGLSGDGTILALLLAGVALAAAMLSGAYWVSDRL